MEEHVKKDLSRKYLQNDCLIVNDGPRDNYIVQFREGDDQQGNISVSHLNMSH